MGVGCAEHSEARSRWERASKQPKTTVGVWGQDGSGGSGIEFLMGYTRLGNLSRLLDRQEVSEVQKHLVWVGRGMSGSK
jgi:hypothetical protein